METKVLAEAYADREADHELDRWIQELPLSDAQKEEGLALAQVSAMAYIRAAFANRETLDADTRKADPMVEISRGGKFAIVPKDGRSDSTNRKLLMKFG